MAALQRVECDGARGEARRLVKGLFQVARAGDDSGLDQVVENGEMEGS